MSIRLIIPDFIPAADRRAVLERIRTDKRHALSDLDGVRARGCVPIDNIKAVRRRIRALADLERAWTAVQMDGVA